MIGPVYPLLRSTPTSLIAIHNRHLHIHQDDIIGAGRVLRPTAMHARNRLFHPHLAVVGDVHRCAGPLQYACDQALVVLAVLDEQHAHARKCISPEGRLDFFRLHTAVIDGGLNGQHGHAHQRPCPNGRAEVRPLTYLRVHDLDIATEHAGQAFADAQPQSRAAVLACGGYIRLRERVEQSGGLVAGHTDAGVNHVDLELGLRGICVYK